MMFGILPNQPGISWESHLFGGITGILVAYIMRSFNVKEDDDLELDTVKPMNEAEKEYYFDRDVFEKSLRDRDKNLY
jgi:hypothetical protein